MLKAKGARTLASTHSIASNTVTNDYYYPKLARILFELAVPPGARDSGTTSLFINLPGGVGGPYLRATGQRHSRHRRGITRHTTDHGSHRHGRCGHLHRDGPLYDGPPTAVWCKAIHTKQMLQKDYIGVDAAPVDLIRPAMYGACHHITVMGQPGGADKVTAPVTNTCDITGNLCEKTISSLSTPELRGIDMDDLAL